VGHVVSRSIALLRVCQDILIHIKGIFLKPEADFLEPSLVFLPLGIGGILRKRRVIDDCLTKQIITAPADKKKFGDFCLGPFYIIVIYFIRFGDFDGPQIMFQAFIFIAFYLFEQLGFVNEPFVCVEGRRDRRIARNRRGIGVSFPLR